MAVIKPKRTSTSGNVPTTSDLEVGEIAINMADSVMYFRDASDNIKSIGIDLSGISEAMIPDTTETYDLGTSSKRWRDLYLSGNTIDLAGATISSDGTGTIAISANGATLPANSKVTTGSTTTAIALQGAEGSTIRQVPFYSKADGLETQNATLNFASTPNRIVANFTLSNGTQLSTDDTTLFYF